MKIVMQKVIYKICSEQTWRAALNKGVYTGSADDIRDGFIHFSTRDQVQGTLRKHFKDQKNLILLAIDTTKLPEQELKYEISGKGEAYPHLYGNLYPNAVIESYKISYSGEQAHSVEF